MSKTLKAVRGQCSRMIGILAYSGQGGLLSDPLIFLLAGNRDLENKQCSEEQSRKPASVLQNTGRASVNVSPWSLLPYLSGKRSYTNSRFINYVLTKSVRTVTSLDSVLLFSSTELSGLFPGLSN